MDGVASVLAAVEQFRGLGPLPSILLAAAAIFLTYSFVRSRKSRSSNAAHAPPATEKDWNVNKNREPGGMFRRFRFVMTLTLIDWLAEEFDYPEIDPCPFPLKDVRPVPYRAFRYGEYQ
jgi:hypothetical protein